MTNLINHLKQLDKDATPAPLTTDCMSYVLGGPCLYDIFDLDDPALVVAQHMQKRDAKLFVSLRNALPQIISLLEAGEKLREAAKSYSEARGDFKLTKEQSNLNAALSEFDTIKKELE